MDDLISKLSEIRSDYNCFSADEEPYYRALSETIRILSQRADGDTISRQAAIDAMGTWDKFGCDPNGILVWYDDNKHYVPYVRYDDMVYVIKSLPSAQPEQVCVATVTLTDEQVKEVAEKAKNAVISVIESEPHWIPCSERLPEYNESVLTWDGYAFCIEKRIPYIRDNGGEPIGGDWWVGDEYDEYESECYPNLRDGAAIAWMPIPKLTGVMLSE